MGDPRFGFEQQARTNDCVPRDESETVSEGETMTLDEYPAGAPRRYDLFELTPDRQTH
jgi:hypothetical protein